MFEFMSALTEVLLNFLTSEGYQIFIERMLTRLGERLARAAASWLWKRRSSSSPTRPAAGPGPASTERPVLRLLVFEVAVHTEEHPPLRELRLELTERSPVGIALADEHDRLMILVVGRCHARTGG